jgi:methyl coenzyme M reductase subunit C-like uncharacterized protein (methanogenesis marker protein 7)
MMDFLEYYAESFNEELGTGAGISSALDRIGRHPKKSSDTPIHHTGSPKDVWNTSPPSSSGYRGNIENYNKMRKLQAQIKKLMKAQEQKILDQTKPQSQEQPEPQGPQPEQQPANVPQGLQSQRDKFKARQRHARYTEALKKYDGIIDDFNKFIEHVIN